VSFREMVKAKPR